MAKQKTKQQDFTQALAAAVGAPSARAEEAEAHFDRRTTMPARELLQLTQLSAMRANPRADVGDVSALVKSIEANGFIGALSVREKGADEFEVWAGNRRLKAAKLAGLKEVLCDVYDLTEVQALELNLAEQINRSDLSPLEEGEACRSLMELSGYTVGQVAEKLGQSPSWVSKRVALCGLAPEVRKAMAKGDVVLTVAQALAALPSQKAQAEALRAMDALPDWERRELQTAEAKLEWLREECSRPLSGATWKLTDEMLVPEAGACSVCPHNSASAKMLGLFDNPKAKPACANPPCFGTKLKTAWEKKSAKAREAGAKVLTLAEGKKVMPHGRLPYGSRYVLADAVVQEDKQKRTWAQLVEALPEGAAPVLHVLQDGEGKARELYVGDKALAAVAQHLKLKWACAQEEQARETMETKKPEAREAERAAASARDEVLNEVLVAIARKYGQGACLPQVRMLADGLRLPESFLAEYLGKAPPKDWLEKGASLDDLLALVWFFDATNKFSSYRDFDEDFLELAKAHGFDPQRMVATRLAADGRAA